MDRYAEIKRLLELGLPVLQISRRAKCTERTVRQIRDGEIPEPDRLKAHVGPVWAEQTDWGSVLQDVLECHPIKFIWNERAKDVVGYKAFWEQFHKKFPHYQKATSVHRAFSPGERCEVDYTGDTIEWIDLHSWDVFSASIFIGVLGYSQKIYAEATSDQKGRNFAESHVRMYRFFEGMPKVTVPDCLKQEVSRVHLYDPDINKSYQSMAQDFGTAIVPARPAHPKDKSKSSWIWKESPVIAAVAIRPVNTSPIPITYQRMPGRISKRRHRTCSRKPGSSARIYKRFWMSCLPRIRLRTCDERRGWSDRPARK